MSLSLTNDRVQRLRRLLGRRSLRVQEGVLVIEGSKVLAEALNAGADVESVYVADDTDDVVVDRAAGSGIRVFELAPGVAEKVGDTVTPQAVFAVVRWQAAPLGHLARPLSLGGFVVVGCAIQDPGNAGTIIRTAESAGAIGVVLCEASVDASNPKTVRSTAGAMFHVPVVQDARSGAEIVRELQGFGVRCWASSSVHTGARYDECDLTGPTALLIGNEANGLTDDVLGAGDGLLTIPMAGRTESLNVAMAAAVLAFEAARQRRTAAG